MSSIARDGEEAPTAFDLCSTAVLAGRVLGPDGVVVVGAGVEVVESSTGDVVGSASTVADGSYRLTLIPELDPVAFEAADLLLRAVDRSGRTFAEHEVTLNPAQTIVLDLYVTAELLSDFEPLTLPLERADGPLLEESTLATIEAAISGLASVDERRRSEYLEAVRRALPPLATLGTFQGDAWGVLEGDADAEERFLQALGRYGRPRPDRQPAEGLSGTVFGLGPDLLPQGRFGKLPLPHPRRCMLPLGRFALVATATLTVSDSQGGAFLRLGELEQALAGLRQVESLLRDAADALEGDEARLLESLDRLSADLGVGDDSLGRMPFPPPYPEPRFTPLAVCEILRRECVGSLVGKLKRPWVVKGGTPQLPAGPSYTITSVSPIGACPGSTVVIKGTNFGSIAGQVCFPTGSGRMCVAATSWSDTEVRATVPAGAGSGTLTLQILEHTVSSCESTIEVYRRGTGAAFTGGTAAILSISVDGKYEKVCVPPNKQVTIAWSTSPAGNVAVRLRIQRAGNVLLDQSGLAAAGSIAFTTPAVTQPTSFGVTVDATNACGTDTQSLEVFVDVVPTIVVEGMEVTQGIQTFWRAGVPENSLPVIAGKDTIVRVYVSANRQGFNNDQVENAFVTLDVDGLRLFPINGFTPANPAGTNPLLPIRRRADIVRGTTDHTFNFRIPAYMCNGTRSLFAYVVAGFCGGHRTVIASRLQSVTWQVETPLRVRFVRVVDNRPAPAGTGTSPTEAEARFTLLRAFDLLPTPATDIAPAITPTWTTAQDFTTLAGLGGLLSDVDGLHDTWEWIFSFLGLTTTPAQDRALWIALTAPFNRGIAGRPGNTSVAAMWTVAMGRTAIPRTTPAHEISHNLDFMHVNRVCGTQTIGGAFYAHPNNGDLQDVPFDPFWNQAIGGTVQDFMSYGCTVWTSADSWTRLQGVI